MVSCNCAGRFGIDFVSLFCFGKPILSPGEGVVVSMRNNTPDNEPGQMNESQPRGNFVVIDHGNGEYSFMAHFKKDSINVSENQRVKAGHFIGLCGNSGRSTEPHLHYHLQNSKTWFKGEGLPTQFTFYWADGKIYRRGEPTAGQLIKNP